MNHDEDLDLLSDEELAECLFEGNVAAFDVLHTRFRGYVMTCCYRVLGDQDAAEEVAQDTFVRAFLKIRYFLQNSKKRNFKAWIGRTACNLAINRWRRERRTKGARTNPSSFQLGDIKASEGSNPVRLLEAEEWRQVLRKVVDELPEPTRTYFVDHYFREMKRIEIAKIYEISINHVDHHLRRGRAIVEREMRKLMQDDNNRN